MQVCHMSAILARKRDCRKTGKPAAAAGDLRGSRPSETLDHPARTDTITKPQGRRKSPRGLSAGRRECILPGCPDHNASGVLFFNTEGTEQTATCRANAGEIQPFPQHDSGLRTACFRGPATAGCRGPGNPAAIVIFTTARQPAAL